MCDDPRTHDVVRTFISGYGAEAAREHSQQLIAQLAGVH